MKAENFGKYIKELRNDRNLTIRQLELYSGVSNSYLSQLENGKRGIPSPAILKKLSNGLKHPYEELLQNAGYLEESDWEKFKKENDIQVLTDDDFEMVPIIGEVKAGYNLLAQENIVGYNFVPKSEMNGGTYFYLRVKGNSMINIGIKEGVLVKVRKQNYIDHDGKIAVVLIDNQEATVKRVYRNDNHIILQAENDDIPPKIYNPEQIKILGQVVKAEIEL